MEQKTNQDGILVLTSLPLVSIIIPTFDRAHLLAFAVQSILEQTYKNWELLVVEDGLHCGHSWEDSRISIHYLESNKGKAAAINYGLQFVNGKYVWIFDDDDIALPQKIESDVQFLEKNSRYDFVYSRMLVTDKNLGRMDIDTMNVGSPPKHLPFYILVYPGCPVHMGTIIAKKDAVLKTRFDEALKLAQDTDFVLRLSSCYSGGFRDEYTMYWRIHDSNSILRKLDDRLLFRQHYLEKYWKENEPSEVYHKIFEGNKDTELVKRRKGLAIKAMSFIMRDLWKSAESTLKQLLETATD